MPRILSVSNQKGGVGKTTTAINLAASLAHLGRPTLLVDLDPQGNASSGVGCPMSEVDAGAYDALIGEATLAEVSWGTSVDGLDVVPAIEALLGAEIELYGLERRERRLEELLRQANGFYDYVICDGPPSLGMLTVNILTAADAVLVPVQAEYFALEGLGMLMRTMDQVRRGLNPRLRREGIIVTMRDPRSRLANEVEEELRRVFGAEVFDTVIPRNVRLSEAPSHGEPALSYEPSSAGARSYLRLAEELLRRNESRLAGEVVA